MLKETTNVEEYIQNLIQKMSSEMRELKSEPSKALEVKRKYHKQLDSFIYKERIEQIKQYIERVCKDNKCAITLKAHKAEQGSTRDKLLVANGAFRYDSSTVPLKFFFIAKYHDQLSVQGTYSMMAYEHSSIH